MAHQVLLGEVKSEVCCHPLSHRSQTNKCELIMFRRRRGWSIDINIVNLSASPSQ